MKLVRHAQKVADQTVLQAADDRKVVLETAVLPMGLLEESMDQDEAMAPHRVVPRDRQTRNALSKMRCDLMRTVTESLTRPN
jgi:hypothetical protein